MPSKTIEDRLEKLVEAVNHESQFFERPSAWLSLKYFLKESGKSLKFLFSEKENITFTVLQMILIIISVYFFAQLMEVSMAALMERGDNKVMIILTSLMGVVSVIFIALISYPIGILTACMTSSYILYTEGKNSTIFGCLKMVLGKSYNLWSLSVFNLRKFVPQTNQKNLEIEDNKISISFDEPDGEIKNKKIQNLCWEIATVAVIPSLLLGRSKEDACYDAFYLLRYKFKPLSKLFVGYKNICRWTIFLTFIFLVTILFLKFQYVDAYFMDTSMSCLFAFVVFPALICFIIIWGIYRPLYIISATRVYLSYTKDRNIKYVPAENYSKGVFVFICYLIFLLLVGGLAVYAWRTGTDNMSFISWVLQNRL